MAGSRKIPRIAPGQPITAALLNRLIDQLNNAIDLSVAPPLSFKQMAGGPRLLALDDNYPLIYVAKTDGSGVSAASGSTLGSGTVTIYRRVTTALASANFTVTAYNIATFAVAADTYIIIGRDGRGDWYVIVEPC